MTLSGRFATSPRSIADAGSIAGAVRPRSIADPASGRSRVSARTLDEDFVDFATSAAPLLRRTAYLMCRDWHLAQDFTQITLTKMYVSWKRVSRSDNINAYSRKVLLRVVLDHRRRLSGRELVIAGPPDGTGAAPLEQPDLRLTMIDALGCLPPRDRAIVVLRYWEDQSVETVAEVLGISTSVVKTQSRRSLARLRELLGDSRADLLTAQT